ncbi:MAG TPA: hypothetical protein VK722_22585 [Candidatus Aquilonibacter sp.]|jgi:hypothetical protein|nr:hypothetical protein [Candidatus Aquilonibacter sp.]
MALSNLTGQTPGTVLTLDEFDPLLDLGASCDQTVRQGTIYGLNPDGSGTGNIVPDGSGTGNIVPDDNLTVQSGQQNIVRAGAGDIVVPHVNGDTVLFVCVVNSAQDLTAQLVS